MVFEQNNVVASDTTCHSDMDGRIILTTSATDGKAQYVRHSIPSNIHIIQFWIQYYWMAHTTPGRCLTKISAVVLKWWKIGNPAVKLCKMAVMSSVELVLKTLNN